MAKKSKDSSIKKKVNKSQAKRKKEEAKKIKEKENQEKIGIENQENEIEVSTSNINDIQKLLGLDEKSSSEELKFLKDRYSCIL